MSPPVFSLSVQPDGGWVLTLSLRALPSHDETTRSFAVGEPAALELDVFSFGETRGMEWRSLGAVTTEALGQLATRLGAPGPKRTRSCLRLPMRDEGAPLSEAAQQPWSARIAFDPGRPRPAVQLGLTLDVARGVLELHDAPDGASLRALLDALDATTPESPRQRALRLYDEQDDGATQAALEEALRLDAEDAVAWFYLGLLREKRLGDEAGACEAFSEVLRVSRRSSGGLHVKARRARLRCLETLGQFEEALRDVDVLLSEQEGGSNLLVQRGRLLAALGQHEAALVEFDHAVLRGGVSPSEALEARAASLNALGRTEEAEHALHAAQAARDEDPMASLFGAELASRVNKLFK
jgi:tetratricopeptide (TPR) repeat protein